MGEKVRLKNIVFANNFHIQKEILTFAKNKYFIQSEYMINRCFYFSLLLLFFAPSLPAQVANWQQDEGYYLSPTVYSSPENPYYWKRRKPLADYWQQDVHYRILCNLQPEYDLIEGKETLTYRNNSGDQLDVVYFHLYQNAFTPDSYLDKYHRQKGEKQSYGRNGDLGKGTLIHLIRHDGNDVKYEIDNTMMKVYLHHPLTPGETTTFEIGFTTYFSGGDSDDRRMKIIGEKIQKENGEVYEVNHYDVVHWYPRIAVYDSRFHWNTDQHLGHEFYGDFGSYDVHINIPEYYILEATGTIQNKEDALPAWLLEKIDIKNFTTPRKYAGEIIPKNNEKTKQWVFHAMNVHDFAFTADPTYRRGEVMNGDVQCVAMARERKADKWQDAAEYNAKFIQLFSEDFGKYLYPKMVVADADDGMEYPMLTLDGGESPGYYSLFAHEIGHNWYFGMLGSNETYRAFMDEGFTQFLTVWGMEKVVGRYDPMLSKFSTLTGKVSTRYMEAYSSYLLAAIHGDDGVLNTHSDDFGGKGESPDYGQVYTKTATMLYNLRYVLGDELFLNSMRFYFNKWKIKHPYPEDFKAAIMEFTKTDLNWFFDQWLNTDKRIDYAVKSVRPQTGKKTVITFERKGEMQMPIEFTAITQEGNIRYYIPNTEFIKPDSSFIVLPKWHTRGTLNPQYTVIIDHRVKDVIIDPYHYLADINLLNNRRNVPVKITPQLFPKVDVFGTWEHYKVQIRPNIWWNGFSGIQTGLTVEGNYMRSLCNFKGNVWYNTGWGSLESPHPGLQQYKNNFQPVSYRFSWSTYLPRWGKASYVGLMSRWMDGLHYHGAEFTHKVPQGDKDSPVYQKIYGRFLWMYRASEANRDYLILPDNWTIGKANATVKVGFESSYQMSAGKGSWDIHLRTSATGGQSQYSYLSTTLKNSLNLGKFVFHHRIFGRYGTGNTPLESALYLAGGSPEEMFDNPFYRSRGFFPYPWSLTPDFTTGHAHFGGGLGLRGYTGTKGALQDGGTTDWYGSSGASMNAELDFNRLIPAFRNSIVGAGVKFRTYLFYDGGILGINDPAPGSILDQTQWGILHHDAGIGMNLQVGNEQLGIKPFTLRSDFPIWVSLPSGGQKPLAFRWLISVSRSF